MFVDIETPKKPLEAEKLYNKCYRGGEEITPEICIKVLQSTNYAACMKRMLLCVERLEVSKQAGFKDVVLSTFHNREQPGDVKAIGERLAKTHGYKGEFDNACAAEVYLNSEAMAHSWTVFDKENYKEVRFPGCRRGVFTKGSVRLTGASHLPEVCDFGKVKEVWLDECDLSGVNKIKLGQNAEVILKKSTNLPHDLDVSRCDVVNMVDCDLSEVDKLCFKAGAEIDLSGTKLPEDIDISGCLVVHLFGCDLRNVPEIRFGKDAFVDLSKAKNLPKRLDFSECGQVHVCGCDLSSVEELKFMDKRQYTMSFAEIAEDWGGELVIAGEVVREKKVKTGAGAVKSKGLAAKIGGLFGRKAGGR